jgi:hypothetical protein
MDVDVLAKRLGWLGEQALRMPRGAYEHQGDRHPVIWGDNFLVGHILPGIGLVLGADGKRLGLARNPRGVFDRTPFMRALEHFLLDEAAAITSQASLVSAYQSTKHAVVFADTINLLGNNVSGSWFETFDVVHTTLFSNPGTTLNRTTSGAWNAAMSDPPSGSTQYLCGMSGFLSGTSVTNNGFSCLILVDALTQSGNQSWNTSATTFTYNTPALTRYTSGVGVYPAITSDANSNLNPPSATTITLSYTNQAGTSGQTSTYSTAGFMAAGNLLNDAGDGVPYFPFFSLAAGDYGCKSIQTVTISQLMGTGVTATPGVFLYHPHIFWQPFADVGMTVERDAATEGTKFLCVLPTEAGGTLGFLGGLYCVSGTNAGDGPAAQQFTLTLDTCWS